MVQRRGALEVCLVADGSPDNNGKLKRNNGDKEQRKEICTDYNSWSIVFLLSTFSK